MKRIRMFTTAAGPSGVFMAGSVIDVPDDIGEQMIAAGNAELVERPLAETATAPAPEMATRTPQQASRQATRRTR